MMSVGMYGGPITHGEYERRSYRDVTPIPPGCRQVLFGDATCEPQAPDFGPIIRHPVYYI